MQVNERNGTALLAYGVGRGAFPARAWYAQVHQMGGDFSMARGGRIPPRPFAVMGEYEFDDIEKLIAEFAQKKWEKLPEMGY